MINILELSCLSNHIYYPDTYATPAFLLYPLPNNKKKLSPPLQRWCCLRQLDPDMKPKNYSYSQLYIKFNGAKATNAVIAIRGSFWLDDYIKDYQSWRHDIENKSYYNTIPEPYYAHTVAYTIIVHDYLNQHFPHLLNNLIFTGHSLGGAIAQFQLLRTGFAYPAVAFNSPGVGHMPGINLRLQNLITNVNSRYGLINKLGETIGRYLQIDIPEDEKEAKEIFKQFSGHHSQNNKTNSLWKNLKTSWEIYCVVKAQHSILNIVHELQKKKNAALAHTII